MISSLARKLAGFGYPNAAEFLLKTGSVILGNKLKIRFHPGNFWTHYKNGWAINERYPDIRFDPDKLLASIKDVYFFNFQPAGNDIFIDVGAGIGMESIYLSRQPGYSGKIYAIEASPLTFEILKANVEDNHLGNIQVYNLAISDLNGTILIDTTQENHITNSVFSKNGMAVKAITMDDFLEENQIETVSLLKVNIEGAEKLLINSFEKIFKVKHVAISCHDFLNKRTGDKNFETKETVARFLKNHNFDIYSKTTGVDYIDDWIYGTNKSYNPF